MTSKIIEKNKTFALEVTNNSDTLQVKGRSDARHILITFGLFSKSTPARVSLSD